MEKLTHYLKQSYNELVHNVTWPTWANLINTTIVVLVSSLIFALLLFIMDAISNSVLSLIYGVN